MIEIPNVLQEIKTEKLRDFTPQNGAVCFNGIGVGAFLGVYDGHGGKRDAHLIVIYLVLLWTVCRRSCDGGEEGRKSKGGVVGGDQQMGYSLEDLLKASAETLGRGTKRMTKTR
ncbi:protein phosphatase 2C 14 [Pyrus ussuriensis x Pyrus communis]|uniref:Protein phosphatase 2C 14 n=1 Tax=Pyrus ussuriensis x Pyrus communis TaxID=2448454 RepID=A0A5N5I483_9ROSA|nr:protein phosphatase 2C 14 [Pyrus ussuriensis x Pyrus communis]